MNPKIIDRYLVKQFLQTTIFALFAFLVIFVVVDMMENLDDFIDNDVASPVVFHYYLYFLPEIIKLMTPVAVFLSCLFVTGKLSNQNELTAIRSSGVSLYRMMFPILLTAAGISIFSFYFGGYVTPFANKEKVKIEITNMKKNIPIPGYNIFFQDSETRIVSIGYFDMTNYQAHKVSIQDFNKNNPIEMVARIDASRMKYDTLKMNWTLYNVVKRFFNGDKEILQKFNEEKISSLNFRPIDVKTKQQKPEEMTTSDLHDFYLNQLKTGNDPTRTLIEYHSRFAFSLSSLIVVFIGFPLASGKKRGGLALQFGISLLFTFIYLGFMKISQAFGKNGVLDPVVTAWSANIIFLVFAIINIIRTPK